MSETKLDALVVPHTHWDRAWYWTVERFRIRLVQCVQGALNLLEKHPAYHFTLDGQVLPLEDYLEVFPQDRKRVTKFVKQGRLKLGPLYSQADVYCTGGEALIRNLLLGRTAAAEFGGYQQSLYMADQFGVVPSLPMIAAGFGINCFIFMRGMADELPGMTEMASLGQAVPRQVPKGTRMFHWLTPDGSRIMVMHLRDGYASAARLGIPAKPGIEWQVDLPKAVEQLIKVADQQNDPQGQPFLLMGGVDHQIPQAELIPAIEAANRKSRYRFVLSDFDRLAEEMSARDQTGWPAYQGEFHGLGAASVLGGTLTSRIYLKQDNARSERLLTDQAEPAAAFAQLAGAPDSASAILPLAWKTLLKAHPHDDICGCSVDAVQQDTEAYIRHARESADAIVRRMTRRLADVFGASRPGDDRYSFLLVNTQATPHTGRVHVTCDFEGHRAFGDYKLPDAYAVVDEQGREVPFVEILRARSTEHPHMMAVLELEPTLAPFQYQRFYLEQRREWPLTGGSAVSSGGAGNVLENPHLRVEVQANGTFDLLEKWSKITYRGLGQLSDQADVGDGYDFADIPTEAEELLTPDWMIERLPACSGLQMVKLSGMLKLPRSSTKEGRSAEKVEMPVEIYLSLGPDSREVECRVKFQNTAGDHRLRWNVALPWKPQVSRAGVKFNEVVRPAGEAPTGTEPPRIHPEHPADPFVDVVENGHGLAVFSEFPFNYEVVAGEPNRLAVTLLRAVAYLSRNDLSTRKGGAGPDTPTPESQCLGRWFDMRWAIRPHAAQESGRIFFASLLWRAQPIYSQLWGYYPVKKDTQLEGPFLECQDDVVLSAFKPTLDGQGVVLRLFNPKTVPVTAHLRLTGVKKMLPVGLHEETLGEEEVTPQPAGFELDIPPFGLRTYRLTVREPWKPKKKA